MVTPSEARDIEGSLHQYDQDDGTPVLHSEYYRWLDVLSTHVHSMVVADLSNQFPGLAADFPGNAKEMRSRSDKDNVGQNLENEHSGYFHEHGKCRIVIVSEDGRQKEE